MSQDAAQNAPKDSVTLIDHSTGKELEIEQEVVAFAPYRPDRRQRVPQEANDASPQVDVDHPIDARVHLQNRPVLRERQEVDAGSRMAGPDGLEERRGQHDTPHPPHLEQQDLAHFTCWK